MRPPAQVFFMSRRQPVPIVFGVQGANRTNVYGVVFAKECRTYRRQDGKSIDCWVY